MESRRDWQSSAVGFAAVFDGDYLNHVAEIVEEVAIISNPEAELTRIDALEALDVTLTGSQQAVQGVENPQRCGLVDPLLYSPAPRYWPNHSTARSITSLRCAGSTKPWPSLGYTTSCVGTC
jgi:hypothetical protein